MLHFCAFTRNKTRWKVVCLEVEIFFVVFLVIRVSYTLEIKREKERERKNHRLFCVLCTIRVHLLAPFAFYYEIVWPKRNCICSSFGAIYIHFCIWSLRLEFKFICLPCTLTKCVRFGYQVMIVLYCVCTWLRSFFFISLSLLNICVNVCLCSVPSFDSLWKGKKKTLCFSLVLQYIEH